MLFRSNPMLGKSITIEFLRKECLRAQEDPSYENVFKRLYLNIRTETRERMISSEKWSINDGFINFAKREVDGARLDKKERESCRERMCKHVSTWGFAEYLKTKTQ